MNQRTFTAKQVHIDEQFLHVDLIDGRRISTPLDWYPELLNASINQLKDYRLICDNTGIEWESLDYHLSVSAMLSVPFYAPQQIRTTGIYA